MRKGFVVILAAALLAVFALPAMAEFNFSGFIRDKYFVSNYERYDAGEVIALKKSTGAADELANPTIPNAAFVPKRVLRLNTDAPTAQYFEQRARLKFEAKAEKVGAVAFFEYDFRYGDIQYAVMRNSGGGLEADTINQETKNLYIWFKPTPNAVVNVGLMNWTDAYRGVLLGYADIAGIFGTYKYEPIDFRYGLGIIKHGATASVAGGPNSLVGTDANNDVQLWVLEGHGSPVKDARAGLNYYFLNDHSGVNATTIHTIGVDGSFKVVEPVTLSAFFFLQTGKTVKGAVSGNDLKYKGWAGDLRADVALGPGKGFIEGIYISGDDNPSDDDFNGIVTSSKYALAGAFYATTDMEILLPNIDDTNSSAALTYDPTNFGQGLLHVGAGYTVPLMDKLTGKIGLGFSRFAKAGPNVAFHNKNQGTEINARLNYNLAKGLDATLTGAYAWLGSAYNLGGNTVIDAVSGASNPDNLYKVLARMNYAF